MRRVSILFRLGSFPHFIHPGVCVILVGIFLLSWVSLLVPLLLVCFDCLLPHLLRLSAALLLRGFVSACVVLVLRGGLSMCFLLFSSPDIVSTGCFVSPEGCCGSFVLFFLPISPIVFSSCCCSEMSAGVVGGLPVSAFPLPVADVDVLLFSVPLVWLLLVSAVTVSGSGCYFYLRLCCPLFFCFYLLLCFCGLLVEFHLYSPPSILLVVALVYPEHGFLAAFLSVCLRPLDACPAFALLVSSVGFLCVSDCRFVPLSVFPH